MQTRWTSGCNSTSSVLLVEKGMSNSLASDSASSCRLGPKQPLNKESLPFWSNGTKARTVLPGSKYTPRPATLF